MLGKFTIEELQHELIPIFVQYWLLCFHLHLVVASIVVHYIQVVHDLMSKESPLQLTNPYHSRKHPHTSTTNYITHQTQMPNLKHIKRTNMQDRGLSEKNTYTICFHKHNSCSLHMSCHKCCFTNLQIHVSCANFCQLTSNQSNVPHQCLNMSLLHNMVFT